MGCGQSLGESCSSSSSSSSSIRVVAGVRIEDDDEDDDEDDRGGVRDLPTNASSPELVGAFWPGKVPEGVIQCDFSGFGGPEAVGFSGGQFSGSSDSSILPHAKAAHPCRASRSKEVAFGEGEEGIIDLWK